MTTWDRAAGVVVRHLSAALDLPSSDITLDAQLAHLENASSLRLLNAVAAVEDERGHFGARPPVHLIHRDVVTRSGTWNSGYRHRPVRLPS